MTKQQLTNSLIPKRAPDYVDAKNNVHFYFPSEKDKKEHLRNLCSALLHCDKQAIKENDKRRKAA